MCIWVIKGSTGQSNVTNGMKYSHTTHYNDAITLQYHLNDSQCPDQIYLVSHYKIHTHNASMPTQYIMDYNKYNITS